MPLYWRLRVGIVTRRDRSSVLRTAIELPGLAVATVVPILVAGLVALAVAGHVLVAIAEGRLVAARGPVVRVPDGVRLAILAVLTTLIGAVAVRVFVPVLARVERSAVLARVGLIPILRLSFGAGTRNQEHREAEPDCDE